MSPERQLVATAVLNGELSADQLTWDEIEEIEARVHELIFERALENAMAEGKIVFSGVEQGELN